jgi:hypothetical protein
MDKTLRRFSGLLDGCGPEKTGKICVAGRRTNRRIRQL